MLLATTADTVVLSEESSSRSCLFSSLSCLFSSLNSERSFLSLAFSASSSSTVGKSLRYKGKQDTAQTARKPFFTAVKHNTMYALMRAHDRPESVRERSEQRPADSLPWKHRGVHRRG